MATTGLTPVLDAMVASELILTAMQPEIPTATEGVDFSPPTTLYQRVQFVVSPPEDPVFGTGYHREIIEMQVFVVGELGVGVYDVYTRAHSIRDTFHKGKTYTRGSARVHILETPQIGGTLPSGNRMVCPVLIPLIVEVYNY